MTGGQRVASMAGTYRSYNAPEESRTARARFLGWMVALCALILLAAGTATAIVERDRIIDSVDNSMSRQLRDFPTPRSVSVDPRTGDVLTTPDEVFAVALRDHAPEPGEAFFGFVNGRLRQQSAGTDAASLARDPAFLETARSLLASGRPGTGTAKTAAGDVRVVVEPISGGDENSYAWVGARDTAEASGDVYDAVGVFALVALVGLALFAAAGWPLVGRLLRTLGAAGSHASGPPLAFAPLTLQRQVLGDAGHELRTPITVMRGHLELLDTGDRAEVAATRTLVLDELDRMGRLVDDLSTLATADRPDFLRLEPVNVGLLVRDIAEKARSLGERDWMVEASEDVTVTADGQRLTQALLQLADNAVRHTSESDTIALGTSLDHVTRSVRLWVRDTGPGVAAADSERIFRRFERAGEGTRGRESGSGLGLAIVAAIAKAHGGRVVLYSTPGVGATFTVVIPLVSDTGVRDDARTEGGGSRAGHVRAVSPVRAVH